MAKVSITYELDYYDDREVFNSIAHHEKVLSVLGDVDGKIRARLKYEEIPEAEEKFLEQLRESMWEVLALVN